MEKMMQYAWKWRLYGNRDLRLTDGRKVRILDPGTFNTTSGPDFFNAKILLDGFEWAGNVELHVKASDWWRHNHHLDPAYAAIILHVVAVNDATLTRPDGIPVPQLLFPLTPQLTELYARLTADASLPPPLRCWHLLSTLPPLLTTDAISTAAFERLKDKGRHIISTLRRLDGDLTHSCVVAIARSLGYGVNSQPFEQTALRLNLNHCARHADDPMQLEAIVLGTAGLLERTPVNADTYFFQLQAEFRFLSHKYGITPLAPEIWKHAGIRPQSSPYRKLAYLARLLPIAHKLVNGILTAKEDAALSLIEMLDVDFTDSFWANHYNFGKPSAQVPAKALNDTSFQLLLINAIAPFQFAMGMLQNDVNLEDAATALLTSLPPEENSLIRDWRRVGIKPRDAFDSQGLIQLRKLYCDRNECLRCRIGNRLLRSHALPALPVPNQ